MAPPTTNPLRRVFAFMDAAEAKRKYEQHRRGAKARGIGFDLSFAEWLAVWGDDLDQRGRGRDQLGMCRVMDKGPYAVGNVFIGTPKRNAHTRRLVTADRKIKLLQSLQEPAPPPDVDEEAENPWLPDELRSVNRCSWDRNHF